MARLRITLYFLWYSEILITSVRHQYGGKVEHVQSNWNSKGFDLVSNRSEIHGYSWSDNRLDKNDIYSSLNMLRSPGWKIEAPSSRFSVPLAILLVYKERWHYFGILLKILREFICFTCFEMAKALTVLTIMFWMWWSNFIDIKSKRHSDVKFVKSHWFIDWCIGLLLDWYC